MTGRMRWLLLPGLAMVICAPWAAGRENLIRVSKIEVPVPPPSHVLDEAGIFRREAERLQGISERLLRLKRDHGFSVYLAVYPGLLRNTIWEQARALVDGWVGAGNDGLVLVFDIDTRLLEVALPRVTSQEPGGNDLLMPRISEDDVKAILEELKSKRLLGSDRREGLDRLTEILVQRLDALLTEEPRKAETASTVKFVVIVLAVGLVLGVLGMGVHRAMSASEARAREQFYFPEVEVASRLGAPYGGGHRSVVDYGSPESPVDYSLMAQPASLPENFDSEVSRTTSPPS